MSSRPALVLLGLSLLAVALPAAVLGPAVVADSGAFSVLVFGVPLACGLGGLVLERRTRGVLGSVGTGLCGLVLLGWAVLLALGLGAALLPAALLLLAAAVVSADSRLRAARRP